MIKKPAYSKSRTNVLKELSVKEYNVFRYLFFKLGKEIKPVEIPRFMIQKAVSLKARQIHYVISKLKDKGLLETWTCRIQRVDKESGWRTIIYYRIPRFLIDLSLWK